LAAGLGRDHFGDQHLQELHHHGVLTHLVVRTPSPTPLSVILVKQDGSRTVVNHGTSGMHLPEDSFPCRDIAASAILFDGHQPIVSEKMARHARNSGIKTILDAGSVHDGSRALIPLVDHVVCSETFARTFTGEDDGHRALSRLADHFPSVVITRGERGILWKDHEHGTGDMPAFKVDTVDSTGAGDAFHGAFAACVAAGKKWLETLTLSCAVGALCCTRIGGRPGIPDKREVDAFLRQHENHI
jgi:sulfofructose kinase